MPMFVGNITMDTMVCKQVMIFFVPSMFAFMLVKLVTTQLELDK